MIKIMTILVVFLTYSVSFAQNYWIKMNFPSTGKVNYIAANSKGDVFCTVYNEGIYRYLKSEAKWDLLTNGWDMSNPKFKDVVVGKNDNIFVYSEKEGIKRSKDNGNSWIDYNFGLELKFPKIKVDNSGMVYVLNNSYLYYLWDTTNFVWAFIYGNSLYDGSNICDFTFDENDNIIICEGFNIYNEGLTTYFSTFVKFDRIGNDTTIIKDTIFGTDYIHKLEIDKNNNLYSIAIFDTGTMQESFLLFSENNKRIWKNETGNLDIFFDFKYGIYVWPWQFIPISRDNIFMSLNQGVIRSINSDFEFELFNDGIEKKSEANALYLSKEGLLYTHMSGDIYYTALPVTDVEYKTTIKSKNNIYLQPNNRQNKNSLQG